MIPKLKSKRQGSLWFLLTACLLVFWTVLRPSRHCIGRKRQRTNIMIQVQEYYASKKKDVVWTSADGYAQAYISNNSEVDIFCD